MEKFFRFYRLQLKAWMKNKICWLQMIALFILVFMMMQIHFPQKENVTIGIGNCNTGIAEQIAQELLNGQSVYQFRIYPKDEKLREDVMQGTIECGFLFAPDFEERYQDKSFKKSITYIATPFSTKGEAAKETIYAAFLRVFGKELILQEQETVFGNRSEEMTQALSSAYENYLDSADIFHTETQFIEQDTFSSEEQKLYPYHGMVGSCVFMVIFLAGVEMTGGEYQNFLKSMELRNRVLLQATNLLAVATPISIATVLLMCNTVVSRGYISELIHMMGLVIISGIEVLLLKSLLKTKSAMWAGLLAMIVLQILVCPVFLNGSTVVPALSYLKYVVPLGYYL